MQNLKPRDIDATKATLFILFIFFAVAALIYFSFAPDVRRLKLAVTLKERAGISLRQTDAELRLQQVNLDDLAKSRAEDLTVLANDFSIERFYKDASRFFTKFDFEAVTINPTSSLRLDKTSIDEYNVSAELMGPDDFYDFIDFMNSYKNALELSLPISVKAGADYRLTWRFGIKVYRSNPDLNQP
jgi:hypothetical protein